MELILLLWSVIFFLIVLCLWAVWTARPKPKSLAPAKGPEGDKDYDAWTNAVDDLESKPRRHSWQPPVEGPPVRLTPDALYARNVDVEARSRRRRDEYFYGAAPHAQTGLVELDYRALEERIAAYKCGMGGEFAGGGASGGWDEPDTRVQPRPWSNPITDVGVCRRDEETAPAYFTPAPSPTYSEPSEQAPSSAPGSEE